MSDRPRTREELKRRLAELNKRISEYPHWGAALTAMDEERSGVQRALANLDRN